jgi:hypothetical protein
MIDHAMDRFREPGDPWNEDGKEPHEPWVRQMERRHRQAQGRGEKCNPSCPLCIKAHHPGKGDEK